jgi:hypothetical protein
MKFPSGIYWIIACSLALAGCSAQRARLVITNQSGEAISGLKVGAAGQAFELGVLAAGEEKEVVLKSYGDSHWTIDARWPDGTVLHRETGYLTHGMNFDDTLELTRGRNVAFDRKAL